MTKRKDANSTLPVNANTEAANGAGEDQPQAPAAVTEPGVSDAASDADGDAGGGGMCSGKYLKDAVYGGLDGIITTFSVVSGVHGTQLSHGVTLVLGFANLLADGLSMATGNYLGTSAELELDAAERSQTLHQIQSQPEAQRARVRALYARRGFTGDDLTRAVTIVTRSHTTWLNELIPPRAHGSTPQPVTAAFVTFLSFVSFGLVPLIVYLAALLVPIHILAAIDILKWIPACDWFNALTGSAATASAAAAAALTPAAAAAAANAAILFRLTLVLTGATAFALGAMKARITGTNPLASGLQTLCLSAAASSVAWGVGFVLKEWCEQLA